MKNLNKKVVLSLITGASIAISSTMVFKDNDFLLPYYYDIDKENIAYDNNIYAFTNNYYDTFNSYLSKQNYSAFASLIVDYNILIPYINNMVPQGITIMNDYFLISMYDYTKISNSVVCVLNKKGDLINICYLNNNAHVGGIAYDSINDLVWITQKDGKIDAYLSNQILNSKYPVPFFWGLDVGSGLENYKYPWINSASFITINENKIYIGSFTLNEPGLVKAYSIVMDDEMKKISLFYENSFFIPDKCQGMAFYKIDDEEFIAFSRSYGRDFSSLLQLFLYDIDKDGYNEKEDDYIVIRTPEMMEQIVFHDNYLYGIFESAADPYLKDAGIDNIFAIDAKKLIKTYKKNAN